MEAPILIVGAGYVGGSLADRLLAEGREVIILRRRAEHPPGSRLIQADLADGATLQGLPSCAQVVYCAAADSGSEEAYERAYLTGLRNLLQALPSPPHVLYVSSTSVYAEAQGGWVDEDDSRLVRHGPSRFIVAGEEFAKEASSAATILRFGGIYGPGRSYFLRRVASGQELLYTGPVQYSNRIHRDDCVGILLHLLGRRDLWGTVYNGVDSEATDRNRVIHWMAEQLGRPLESLARTDDSSLIPHRGNKRISNRKILASGYTYQYPSFREGYRELLDEFR